MAALSPTSLTAAFDGSCYGGPARELQKKAYRSRTRGGLPTLTRSGQRGSWLSAGTAKK
jgi:hypothetical protein